MTTNPMYGGTFEEWLNDRPISRQQADAEFERFAELATQERAHYEAKLNEACAAIQSIPRHMIDAVFVAQVLYTLSSAAASNGGLKKEVDALDIAICEVESA